MNLKKLFNNRLLVLLAFISILFLILLVRLIQVIFFDTHIQYNDKSTYTMQIDEVKSSQDVSGINYITPSLSPSETPATIYKRPLFESIQLITYTDNDNKVQFNDLDSLMLAQYLMFTDWEAAKLATTPTMTETDLVIPIQVESNKDVIQLSYNLDNNTMLIYDQYYYADLRVLFLMHRIFEPHSLIGQIETLMNQAHLEIINTDKEDRHEKLYDFRQFDIDGLNTLEWIEYAKNKLTGETLFTYADYITDTLEDVIYYDKEQLLLANHLYFLADNYETEGGVKVGLTKKEVKKILGKANSVTDTSWGYLTGDYLRFNLLFEENKVKYIYFLAPH